MKLLRIISTMDPAYGGPCQGIRNSIPAMEKIGVKNEVLTFDKEEDTSRYNDPFIIHAIGPKKGPYAYCKNLEKWLLTNYHRFDAIIIHGLWLYNSYGTYTTWKKIKKKDLAKSPALFVMPHGMLDPYFQKAKGRRIKALRNWFFWHIIEKKVINGVDGVLFTCEQELILAREPFSPYYPKAELNVGYGIQAPPQYDEDFYLDFVTTCPEIKDKPYWLFLSRIHPKKGVDLLVKAYIQLKDINPNIPDLVIAGPGLDTTFGTVLLKNTEKISTIHFPGMLTGNAKWGAFYCSEAFILPSHQENFGIAVVEALACKKPVLITNKVNIWMEVEAGQGGLIAEDNADSVYKNLVKLVLMNTNDLQNMGANAAQVYKKHFKIDEAARRMTVSIQNEIFEPSRKV